MSITKSINRSSPHTGSFELGSVLMCGVAGPVLSAAEAQMLQKISPAGVILFAKNFLKNSADWISQYEKLVEQLRSAIGRERFFLAVDHEGGRVHRFPAPVTRFPAAAHWRDSAAEVGRAMGRELKALGINLAFAPVLDVHNESSNPVIGERAFARTVEEVIRFAEPFRAGLEAEGVIGCGKHFPGHGRTTTDSHHELPLLQVTRAELEATELAPFRSSIENGLKMIMTAHVHYPKIDPLQPATLSRIILTEILRGELGFNGVVISDDLEMKALSHRPVEENSLLALAAGVDLLLVAHNNTALPLEDALRVRDRLEQECSSDRSVRSQIAGAAERIDRLLNQTSFSRQPAFSVCQNSLGTAPHLELAQSIGKNTITV